MTIFYFLCTKDKIITLEIFIYLQLLNIIGEKIKLLIEIRLHSHEKDILKYD